MFSFFKDSKKERLKRGRPTRRPPLLSILVGQEKGGYAAVSLGDDPEAIGAIAFGWLAGINGIGGQDTATLLCCAVVLGGVFFADVPPIAACMAGQTGKKSCMWDGL